MSCLFYNQSVEPLDENGKQTQEEAVQTRAPHYTWLCHKVMLILSPSTNTHTSWFSLFNRVANLGGGIGSDHR